MLRSKKDVDRHVRDLLNKIKTEEERKVRGYNIARLYYNINEYESARRYLSEFLSARPKAVDAHRLLGQIYEGLGNKENAVKSFKMAYELEGGQKDLVLKICELYTEVEADSSVRLYWAEEGQRIYPHHPSVVKLREALLTGSGSHSREELEKLYLDEIKASPMEVRLQTNLLRLYSDWGAEDKNKLNEAYNYGCQVENRKAFSDSLEWYQTLIEVMEAYQNTTDVNSEVEFHINFLSALERLVYLTLASSSGTALLSQCTLTDAATLLHKFDQTLHTSLNVVGLNSKFGQLMVGQLYFHMAVFLLHSAKKDGLSHKSTSAGALLFHACRFRPTEGSQQSKSWTTRDQFWNKLACHRLSQVAHTLNHMAKTETERSQFINKVKQQCSNKEAQHNLYQTIYGSSQANKKEKSFFLNDSNFINASLSYPDPEQVKEWDNIVGVMYCGSLGDMVWLCLQQVSGSLKEPQPYYTFTLFEGLQFSSASVNTGAAETLCHLDLLSFLAATVYCQMAASKEARGPPPASLPTILASALNTTEQADWWNAAYTLFTNRAHHRLSKLRLTLQRGLEVVRAHGNHGLDLPLMAHLAQCFTKWADAASVDGSTNSEIEALKDRAELYWQRVLTLCQRAARNVTNLIPRNPLFVVQNVTLSSEERQKIEEEGKYFLATRLVSVGKHQEAIQALGELKSPEASFQRAMLYKERAQAVVGEGSLESVTSEMRSQYTILLTQARDTLYLTLDRLRMPGVDRFHPLNTKLSQQLEDVERRLSHTSLDQDTGVQREDNTESISDASQSSNLDLTNGHLSSAIPQTPQMFSTPFRDKSSSRITRQEARPSPERLDTQVRALTEVQENTLKNMEEQNAALRNQNEALRNLCSTMAEEFKENSAMYRSMLEQNKSLSQDAYTSIVSEMKLIHTAIKDLETQIHAIAADVGELRSLRSDPKHAEVADMKASEDSVPVDIPAAAVVPQNLYGGYMGYYPQQPVPSPLVPAPGIFGNPPFFPPSTLPEQSYSLPSSVSQVVTASSLAQMTSSLVTPTMGSPSPLGVKEPLPSPTGSSVPQSLPASSVGGLSWSISSTLPGSSPVASLSKAPTSGAPHAFQIPLPPMSAALTPPPRSVPAFTGAFRSPAAAIETKVSPNKSVEAAEDDNGHYVEDDHDPCPDYKPLVPLPEKVEVRTGEEDEKVLFEERSKLYRFLDKEWKERGTGMMKLLHNPSQATVRVLMRRDQTHKICANHLVTANTELQPRKDSDKVWIWAAQDFADEELKPEKFCCRFKTVEIATTFKEAFMKAKAIAKEREEAPKDSATSAEIQPVVKGASGGAAAVSLSSMFKPPPGSWSCQTCLVVNKAENAECVACSSPNPSAPAASQPQSTATSPYATFKFTPSTAKADGVVFASSAGFQFITTTSSSTIKTSPPNITSGTGFGFKFGLGNNTAVSPSVSIVPVSSSAPEPATDKSKFSLSGFTFTTTPSIMPDKPEEPIIKPQEEKKESIFSGFSFGSSVVSSAPTTGFTFSTPTTSSKETAGGLSGGLFGGRTSGTTLSFTSVGQAGTPSTSFNTKDTKTFEPKSLFEKVDSPVKSPSKGDTSEDRVEDYEPCVDFQPVVPMPDLVEVKTGEEEEEVLFCERAKLFRYDKEGREWKERGVGELKILKNIKSGKIRVLMRRDQVLKVCANHMISTEMKLTPMASSDKAWIWAAHDFADEEMKEEQFAARFKTAELALSFKTAFEKAQQTCDTTTAEAKCPQSTQASAASSAAPSSTSLAAMFKPAAGSWECDMCLVRNKSDCTTCVSCSTPKPGSQSSAEVVSTSTPTFSAGSQPAKPSLSSLFQPAAGSWECSSCLVRNGSEASTCVACGGPGVGGEENKSSFSFSLKMDGASSGFTFGATTDNKSSFSFGVTPSSQAAAVSTTTSTALTFDNKPTQDAGTKPPFSFGISNSQPGNTQEATTTSEASKPAFSFGTTSNQETKPFTFTWQPANTSSDTATSSSTKPVPIPATSRADDASPTKGENASFVFGSPGKYEFSFAGVKAKSPRSRDISQCESEDGVLDEDEGDHLYFEPVVPLPDKVEVVTGEESEEMLYVHRAKLFRLVTGEWKERGLGDIKILKHKQSGKIRLLMRREQVHKICLNHYLAKDLELRRKDDKTFFWAAVDYTETPPQNETFAIRFKTPEIAMDFYHAVNDAKVKLGGTPSEVPELNISSEPKEEKGTDNVVVACADSSSPAPVTNFTPTKPLFAESSVGKGTPSLFGGRETSSPSIFSGTPKSTSIFGGVSVGSPSPIGKPAASISSILGGVQPSSQSIFGGSVTTTASIFGGGAASPSVFGGAAAFGTGTNTTSMFSGNTSAGFSFKNTVQEGSLFGHSTSTPQPAFSFGDRFSSEPDSTAVEIVYEKKASPEQIERARKLLLPDNFYLYEDAPPCPGCQGCEAARTTPLKEKKDGSGGEATADSGKSFTTPLFGLKDQTASPSSLFGRAVLPSSGSIFGGAPASAPSTFTISEGVTSMFGNAGNTPTTSSTVTFAKIGSTGATPTFGGKTGFMFEGKSLFGGTTTTTSAVTTTTATTPSQGGLFSSVGASHISFGDIAAQSSGSPGFSPANTTASSVWSARGQPVFSKNSPHKSGNEDEEATEDDAHDPHFEPVVPLPDLVEVKTGEEELEVIFSQRAKLYRYDGPTKQWKERGVGDFKILHDAANHKYRLLQRREMVHKLCCNHYLTPLLELRPLQTSETAWCWYAKDYSEGLEGTDEQLALRFKTVELAKEFKNKFEMCQEKLRSQQAGDCSSSSTSAVVVLPSQAPGKSVEELLAEEVEEEDDDDDEDDDEDEDEDEDEDDYEDEEDEDCNDGSIIFSDQCTLYKKENTAWTTLGFGELRIRYDDEVYGARISVTSDEGATMAEHLIAIQTTMHREGERQASWTVLNLSPPPQCTTTFKAEFPNSQGLEEFVKAFSEGKEYADKADIYEQPGRAATDIASQELFYSRGGGAQD